MITALMFGPVRTFKRGFNLIELLVVIGIIAVLMGLLMPSLRRSLAIAKTLQCRSNLRHVGLALSFYLQDNDFRTPNVDRTNGFHWFDSQGKIRGLDDSEAYWGVAYIDYIDNIDVFGCPSYRHVERLIYQDDPELINQAAFSLNAFAVNLKTSAVRHHAEFIMAHDHVEPKIEHGSRDMLHNDGIGTKNLTIYREGGQRADFYPHIFRHEIRSSRAFQTGGKLNILWLDGHVSPLRETLGDDVPSRWYTGKN